MTNLVDIQSQIEKLQKQASQIKAKEFDKTVREICEKMYAFGITVKDLQVAKVSTGKVARDPAKKRTAMKDKKTVATTVPAKYRGPEGQTWSGRGLTPRWLKSLLDLGRQKEEFLVKP